MPQLARSIREHGVRITDQHLYRCERGSRRPSQSLLMAWAAALRIRPVDIDLPTEQLDDPTGDTAS